MKIMRCVSRISLLALFLFIQLSMAEHPYHPAFYEFRINRGEKMVEVSARFFAEDVAEFVNGTRQKKIDIGKLHKEEMKTLLWAHFQEHIRLKNHKGKTLPLRWVGYQMDLPYVWFYMESPLTEKKEHIDRPHISTFCLSNSQFYFLVYLYEGDRTIDSYVLRCE